MALDRAGVSSTRRIGRFPRSISTTADHLAFSRWFGPLERATRSAPRPGQRRRLHSPRQHRRRRRSRGRPVESSRVKSLVGNQEWHSDSSFKRVPAKASILAAVVVPVPGGETRVRRHAGRLRRACSVDERERIEGLVAQHSFAGDAYLTDAEREILAPVEHPIVQRHPATGRRALFVGRHARAVVGIDPDEGRRLIDELREHACRPPRIYTHRWSCGRRRRVGQPVCVAPRAAVGHGPASGDAPAHHRRRR